MTRAYACMLSLALNLMYTCIHSQQTTRLSNNRCILTTTLALEPDNVRDTVINSNFVSILKEDVKSLTNLPYLPGSVIDEFYCSQKHEILNFGFPISVTQLPTLKHKKGNFMVNILLFIRKTTFFCTFNDVLLTDNACRKELTRISNLLGCTVPTIPNKEPKTETHTHLNLHFKSYVLVYEPNKLYFSSNNNLSLCSQDTGFQIVSNLRKEAENARNNLSFEIYKKNEVNARKNLSICGL